MLSPSEYNLDLRIPWKKKVEEVEESSFIIDNNGSLISECQWIQYDSTNKWKTKVYEAEQPQHQMAIENHELNWLSFLKL